MDMMQLRRSLLTSGDYVAPWKQKTVVVRDAISLASGFANLITSNIPSDAIIALICKDNLDDTQYINNQLVCGIYGSNISSACNILARYRNGTYNTLYGDATWGNTYALTASQGDSYTIFYQ